MMVMMMMGMTEKTMLMMMRQIGIIHIATVIITTAGGID